MGEPVFLALLTADRVITEKNDKKGIIGTFNRLGAQRLPASFPPWWIYASATNLIGEHEFSIDIVADDPDRRIFSANGRLRIGSPSQIIEIAIPVLACLFPKAGNYTVLFNLDGSQLGARVLKVERVTAGQPLPTTETPGEPGIHETPASSESSDASTGLEDEPENPPNGDPM